MSVSVGLLLVSGAYDRVVSELLMTFDGGIRRCRASPHSSS